LVSIPARRGIPNHRRTAYKYMTSSALTPRSHRDIPGWTPRGVVDTRRPVLGSRAVAFRLRGFGQAQWLFAEPGGWARPPTAAISFPGPRTPTSSADFGEYRHHKGVTRRQPRPSTQSADHARTPMGSCIQPEWVLESIDSDHKSSGSAARAHSTVLGSE